MSDDDRKPPPPGLAISPEFRASVALCVHHAAGHAERIPRFEPIASARRRIMRMRKFAATAIASVAVGLAALAGPSTVHASTLVAFVTNNPSQYWTIAQKGVNAEAKKFPDINVQFIMPADGTAATQKSDVNDVLARGAKAIAISPVDPKNQTPWLNQVAAKAPVLTQDSDAPQSHRLCYIGTDNHAAGVMAGQWIKKVLGPAGGKIVLFVGDRSAQNAHDREQGIRDAIAGSKVTILDVRTDDADHARAKANASDELVKYPDLAMEVGLWSYNGPAIVSALQDSGKIGKVKVVCFDQEPATISGIRSGAIAATIVQQPYEFGELAVKVMDELVHGNRSSIPASGAIYIPTQAITAANLNAYMASQAKLMAGS
jgi:ribose transport system substrate-binding protein